MRFQKLAALGAVGACFGLAALYALIAWAAIPSPQGGMDRTNAVVTWISVAVPVLAIIAAHLAYAKILLEASRTSAER